MKSTLSIVGEAADFVDAASNKGPDWEHLVMLRDPDCTSVVLDRLRSPPSPRVLGRKLAELPFVWRFSKLLETEVIDLPFIWRLSKILGRSDAILAQSEQSGYQVALASLLSIRRRPLFIVFHGHGWSGRRNRTFAAVVRRMRSVQLLCLSDALRNLVITEYGIPPDRVHVTGYGVDHRYFSPVANMDCRLVLSAGTASRDYRTLATACAGIDASFRVAADSNWHVTPLNLRPADIPANMTVASAGGYEALRSLYANALFVVVPMLDVRYACGYAVIAEAMAMGKAVIVTKTGCPSDLIEDGVNGLYVPPGDAIALREAIQDLLAHPEKAIAMGNAARRKIEDSANLDAYVERILKVVRRNALS